VHPTEKMLATSMLTPTFTVRSSPLVSGVTRTLEASYFVNALGVTSTDGLIRTLVHVYTSTRQRTADISGFICILFPRVK